MTVGRVKDFPTGRTPGYASGGHLKGGPTIGTKKGSKLKIDIPGGLPRSSASTDDPSAPENALASRGRIARSRAGMPGLGNTARRSAMPMTAAPGALSSPMAAPVAGPKRDIASMKKGGKAKHRYAEGGKVHDDAAMDRKMIAAAMKRDDAEDKRMAKSAIRQHETQEHGGKHSTIKLAKGGSVADQPGLDAANKKAEARIAALNIREAQNPRKTTKPAKNARSYPAFACGGSVKSAMPQMYGNDAKRRGR